MFNKIELLQNYLKIKVVFEKRSLYSDESVKAPITAEKMLACLLTSTRPSDAVNDHGVQKFSNRLKNEL